MQVGAFDSTLVTVRHCPLHVGQGEIQGRTDGFDRLEVLVESLKQKETAMQITPYLNFDGNCREAMEFYGRVLGAKPMIMRFGDSPMRDEFPDAADRTMHAYLEAEGAVLMASDTMPGASAEEAGISNGNIALSVSDVEKAEAMFKAFAEGGQVTMPFEETFWVERFGIAVDRFGVTWLINGGRDKS